MTASKSRRIAKAGEIHAANYLAHNGYTVIERNWRNGRRGELDLIAQTPEGLTVFVEVKTRTIDEIEPGIQTSGFESINARKQMKIIRTASAYLARANKEQEARFDVALVTVGTGEAALEAEDMVIQQIVYIEGAFSPK